MLRWQKICAVAAVMLLMAGCMMESGRTVKIGFVAGLSGRGSDLGVSGRNAAMLAVEEANARGGIRGRKIELIVKDDENTASGALQADRELIGAGVAAIIGHMTSAESLAAVPYINQQQVVMVSPTTRTPRLMKQDDMFFSVIPSLEGGAQLQGEYAIAKTNVRRLAVLYDKGNQEYAEDWLQAFAGRFEAQGGKIVAMRGYASQNNTDFWQVIQPVMQFQPEGVLLIAGGIDAALLCQQIHKYNPQLTIFSSGWAMTNEFLQHGGRAVEDVIFSNSAHLRDDGAAYASFSQRYEQRFGLAPDLWAAYSYNATLVIIEGLQQNNEPRRLKEQLLRMESFAGVLGPFRFDANGDVSGQDIILRVKQGRFEKEQW